MPASRFDRLPRCRLLGREVPVAVGLRARLLGLSGLAVEEAGTGLLIPRCASVHTVGMRFPLDLAFLDCEGRVLALRPGVPPRRWAWHRGAAAVLEVPSPAGGRDRLSPVLGGRCCRTDRRSRPSSSARTTR